MTSDTISTILENLIVIIFLGHVLAAALAKDREGEMRNLAWAVVVMLSIVAVRIQ